VGTIEGAVGVSPAFLPPQATADDAMTTNTLIVFVHMTTPVPTVILNANTAFVNSKHPTTFTYVLTWLLADICLVSAIVGTLLLAFVIVRHSQMGAESLRSLLGFAALLNAPGIFLIRHVLRRVRSTRQTGTRALIGMWSGIRVGMLIDWYVLSGALVAVVTISRRTDLGALASAILFTLAGVLILWGIFSWRQLRRRR
jgi:hypothetical protein